MQIPYSYAPDVNLHWFVCKGITNNRWNHCLPVFPFSLTKVDDSCREGGGGQGGGGGRVCRFPNFFYSVSSIQF